MQSYCPQREDDMERSRSHLEQELPGRLFYAMTFVLENRKAAPCLLEVITTRGKVVSYMSSPLPQDGCLLGQPSEWTTGVTPHPPDPLSQETSSSFCHRRSHT
ncbi:Hypothetical predicted protein [Marmota monax]|uniref:Uncharacterized protein n=1 Tax=Marmota monax TaxID=9995 RepID=A0A5E4AH65_MARMO|nr:hypothetical protein GHT09_002405 [Marmota monax]VTJ56139.1 Hypothetical predicted protein [Marmota monax]